MKKFNVPSVYRSGLITAIKNQRKKEDKLKKDFTPTLLDFGPLQIFLARHFGFCYGVENAIEKAFSTIDENPGKRIFLLSEMIHNPQVNRDLIAKGVRFLQDTSGRTLIDFDELNSSDIVIIPAFGTTLHIEARLRNIGITIEKYNTTCPFVEKVWNRGEQIAEKGYSIVLHGKPTHEETRATFSHSAANTPTVIVNDLQDAKKLERYIRGEKSLIEFYTEFEGRYSPGFDVDKDLKRIGVINQTTMLASDTQGISDYLKHVMIDHYKLSDENIDDHFADTRDTLCYATNDNQSAVYGLLDAEADLAIVVGGYNSSNTSHLVELCEEKLPTYYIDSADKLLSSTEILHYNFHNKEQVHTVNYLPVKDQLRVLLTSGASCPDAVVENVILKLLSYFDTPIRIEDIAARFE